MSMDGFYAFVKIDRIKVCTGKQLGQPYNDYQIEASGGLSELEEVGYSSGKIDGKKINGVVRATLKVGEGFDDDNELPEELQGKSIGSVHYCVSENGFSPFRSEPAEVLAVVEASIDLITLQMILHNSDKWLRLEPIFLRQDRKKIVGKWKSNNKFFIMYIERLYVSTDFELDEIEKKD